MITKRAFLSTVAMAGTAAIGLNASAFRRALAQSYPSRVIRIIVPWSASTPPDILARIVATALSESEGWNVIVENKPGAVGTIGSSNPPTATRCSQSARRSQQSRLSFPMQNSSWRPT